MTLNEIEYALMEANSGDSIVLHEMLVKLLEVVREQERRIDRLLEDVPSASYSESMQEYKHRFPGK